MLEPLVSVRSHRMPVLSVHLRATALFCLVGAAAARLDAQDTTAVERDSVPPNASPMLFVTPFLSAGWSQTLGTPKAWKRTWGGYGARVGDQVGYLAVKSGVRYVVGRAVPWVEDRSP